MVESFIYPILLSEDVPLWLQVISMLISSPPKQPHLLKRSTLKLELFREGSIDSQGLSQCWYWEETHW